MREGWGRDEIAMVNAPPPPVWPDRRPVIVTDVSPPGGFWIRFVAYMIDGLVLTVAAGAIVGLFVLFVIGSADANEDETSPAIAFAIVLMILALLLIGWLYEALMTSSRRGATLGKQALGLRIIRADGARLSFRRATARYFLKYIITPLVPLLIGYLMAAFTARKRALHDVLADTLVIRSS
jgi:uncharacterized RDD family membrane protein YckC